MDELREIRASYKTAGQEDAFPTTGKHIASGETGLTKREYFACQILAGILANNSAVPMMTKRADAAREAVLQADDLIAALNEKS
jgi:hypothetical protein